MALVFEKRELSYIWAYFTFIQHKNFISCRFVANSSYSTFDTNWEFNCKNETKNTSTSEEPLQTERKSRVTNSSHMTSNALIPQIAYCFMVLMLNEWEVCLYTIISLSPPLAPVVVVWPPVWLLTSFLQLKRFNLKPVHKLIKSP